MSQSLVVTHNVIGNVDVLPAATPSEGEARLDTFDSAAIGQGLEFFDRFAGKEDAQSILASIAEKESQVFLANPSTIIDYGSDVLEQVAAVTNEILKFTKGGKLPEEDDVALRSLTVQLKKAGGYDMTVAANLAKYREMKEKLGSRFGSGKAKQWFAAFEADRQTLEEAADQMSGDFVARAKKRAVAANLTFEILEANRESLGHLEERVAVLEKARELTQRQREALPDALDPSDPLAKKAAAIDMVLRMLDVKVTNLAARWYVGVGLDPMLRAMQEQQIMMSMRLYDISQNGLPKFKLVMSQYSMTLELQKDADTVTAFEGFDNKMTQELFAAMHKTTVQVARTTTRSGVTEQTITTIANEVAGMVADVTQVYATARADNQSMVNAMMKGAEVMKSAQDKPIDKALVATVVSEARRSRSLLG